MAFSNNVMIVRHRLMSELVRLWKSGSLVDEIDRVPLRFSPRLAKPRGRCCIHKERVVWKYKSLPLLGYDMSDEQDELTPLSAYAKNALEREKPSKNNLLCVIDEACSSCVQVNYEVSNLCKGCVAQGCYTNCPKDAVFFKRNGQAEIDHDKCISCGLCQKNCPYHAIVYIPVPCEEACPVKAIKKDENGIERIDEDRCIYCGKCVNACPFGAIFEISQVFDVLQGIRAGRKMIAIPAPSVLGQFKTSIDKVYGALKEMGFYDVIEVAQGAMDTISNEAHELLEKLDGGQPFMTTSCCPAYIELTEKHIPDIKPFVSHTGSPMYYAARIAKEQHPDGEIVFIGPCLAKRKEATRDEAVDYVMTFEELAAVLEGMGIEVEQTEQRFTPIFTSVREAHGFAQAGGVMRSVQAYLKEKSSLFTAMHVSDIDRKSITLLRSAAKTKKAPAQFIEVMACPGGCITGPCAHGDTAQGERRLAAELAKRTETYADMEY